MKKSRPNPGNQKNKLATPARGGAAKEDGIEN